MSVNVPVRHITTAVDPSIIVVNRPDESEEHKLKLGSETQGESERDVYFGLH